MKFIHLLLSALSTVRTPSIFRSSATDVFGFVVAVVAIFVAVCRVPCAVCRVGGFGEHTFFIASVVVVGVCLPHHGFPLPLRRRRGVFTVRLPEVRRVSLIV